ncbi:EF-hand domain-containing protein [Durusdinium trenchii]|uniref:EF-hand domain-containing protein n=1 Tax=Durusdinium trenchii TaxID=1381693 RepID=A0ABP0J3S1_9DINO
MPEMVETVRSSSSGAKSGHPLEFLVTRPAGSAKAVPLGGPMGPPAGPAGAGPGPPQRVPVVGSIPATTQASPMRCVHCKHAEHELEMLRKEHQSLQQQLAEMRQMGDAQEGTSVQRCVRCKTAEQELEMLRREQHSLEQQLLLSKQQLQHAEEEGRQQLKSLTEMDRKLAQATAKLREAEKLKASLEPEVQAQANTEAALCAWRTEAESHRASLEAAEQRCAEQLRRAQAARRHAAEVERQRKEVVRNSGLQVRNRLCEELNTALAEKAEMDKRLKKALRVSAEEQRLRTSLAQEMEAATVELQAYKDEALEASKAKEQLQKQRRFAKSEAGQAESLQRQFSEAEQQRRALQVELAKSQRLRQEEQKKRQAACAERDQVQQELQQWRTVGLADRLRQVEEQYHVTLLFVGNASDAEIARANPTMLRNASAVQELRRRLRRHEGQPVQVEVSDFVWEDGHIAAAPAQLANTERGLCANVHPHMTLGMAPGAMAVESNGLLARRFAEHHFHAGLAEWLRQIGLGQYTKILSLWCRKNQVTTLEELSGRAAKAAAAIEPDPSRRAEVEKILRSSLARRINELPTARLQLQGTIEAHRAAFVVV